MFITAVGVLFLIKITDIIIHCIHYLSYFIYHLSVFSLAKSLLLTLKISATYRLVSYLLADTWHLTSTSLDLD